MWTMRAFLGLVAGALLMTACERESATEPSIASDIVSEADLRLLMERADGGDAEAAFRVAVHYEADPTEEARAIEWLTKAANLDHDVATQHLATILMGRGGADCEQGVAWFRRLDARVTDPSSRESLGIDEVLNSQGSCTQSPDSP
jgi:TPR repeat protein